MARIESDRLSKKAGGLLATILIAISVIVGAGTVLLARSDMSVLWLLPVLAIPFLFIRLRFWVSTLLFLSIATISLSVYQVPLPRNQSLQLMRLLLLMVIAVSALASLQKDRILIRLPTTAIGLGLFLSYMLLSFMMRSARDYESLSLLVATAFGFLYSLALPQIILDRARLKLAILGVVAASLLIFLFAVYQYGAWITGFQMQGFSFTVPFNSIFGDRATASLVLPVRAGPFFRLTLPFSSSSHLGPCIAALMLITLPLQVSPYPSRRLRWWLGIYHAVMFVLMLMTLSRGAWLGWFAGLLVILIYGKHWTKIKRVLPILVLLIVAGLIVAAVQPEIVQIVGDRFDRVGTNASDQKHLDFALLAVDMFVNNPILGGGLGEYFLSTGVSHPHNTYLHILGELGIMGLIFISIWILLVIWYGYRAVHLSRAGSFENAVSLGLLAAFVSILTNNLFQQSIYASFTFMIAGLIGATYFVVRGERSHRIRTGSL